MRLRPSTLPSNCTDCYARVQTLNAAIPAWATTVSTTASPVYVVDLWTGMDMATDAADGVHPNATGSQKMATKLVTAIEAKNLL
jgi:lysophospholipase L1-like esterase